MVSPEYLSVLQVPLVRGRGLASSDSAGGARVLVVSEAFARQAFGRVDVVGEHIDWNDDRWTIVGVARDVRHASLWQAPDADAYVPRAQVPRSPTWLVLRTKQPGPIVAGQIYERLKAEAPQLALTDAATMSGLLAANLAPERFRALLTGVIAALSLVLAVVGLHGVVAYAVSRRSREIGVRIALGARRSTVLGQIFRESGRVVALGLVPGVGGAVMLARWLSSQGVVQASIGGAIGATVAIFATAAFIATFTPARRASRVDPVSVLRSE
jgi:putative ABC transport system permease protein